MIPQSGGLFMKKQQLIVLSLLLGASGLAASSLAQASTFYPNGYYLGGGLSVAQMSLGSLSSSTGRLKNSNPDTVVKPGAYLKFGYFMKSLPLQFDLSYVRKADFDYKQNPLYTAGSDNFKSTITAQALFANITLDGNFGWPVMPFVTAGYGLAVNDVNSTSSNGSNPGTDDGTDFNGAWQAGVGTHIFFTRNLMLDAAYMHQNLGSLTWGPWGNNNHKLTNDALTDNEINLGLTYVFGDQHMPPSLIDGTE